MSLFDNLFPRHTLPVIGEDGLPTIRRATCTEVEGQHAPHTRVVMVAGPKGPEAQTELVSCLAAEMERQELLTVRSENTRLKSEVANYQRLVAGAMQIVFHMGPALQALLAETLSDPTLTDDKSAVKVEAVLFTVLIDPFKEIVTVRDVAGLVPERSFRVVGGRLSEDDQTLLLGVVDRIKTANEKGADPVKSTITVVAQDA